MQPAVRFRTLGRMHFPLRTRRKVSFRQWLWAGVGFTLGASSLHAACSRPVLVPVSAVGVLIYREHDDIAGALPDLLREVGSRTGCHFIFKDVPRARAEHMAFEEQSGDVFMPARRTARRDATHVYVPIYRDGLALVSRRAGPEIPDRLAELRERADLRAAFVRGFWLGPQYASFVDEAVADRRAYLVADLPTIGRMIAVGRIAYTLIGWIGGTGALTPPEQSAEPADVFRVTLVRDVKFLDSGLYLSRANLPDEDRQILVQALEAAVADGTVRRIYSRHFPPEVIAGTQWQLD